MNPVKTIEGKAYPFGLKNVDTDIIIPAHWLKTISRTGLGKGAFEALRKEPNNLFDSAEYAGSPILIAGDNFGCGSSREHAAWAMPSYSDIFSSNAFKNGLLAVVLPQEAIDRLMEVAKTDPIHIDLENQMVTTPFQDRFPFEIDPFRKECLLGGLDEIGITLARSDAISDYEAKVRAEKPWLVPQAV
jgi:3-isopropylmalate/(R)-2-methylmalate dehydratase small subunit